jgi:predicted aminopeptidase
MKRYTLIIGDHQVGLEEQKSGDWVRFYEAIREIDDLKAKVARLAKALAHIVDVVESLENEDE